MVRREGDILHQVPWEDTCDVSGDNSNKVSCNITSGCLVMFLYIVSGNVASWCLVIFLVKYLVILLPDVSDNFTSGCFMIFLVE